MSLFLFEIAFSPPQWEQWIENPGPLLRRFDQELRPDPKEGSLEILLVWPSERMAWVVVEGPGSIAARLDTAIEAIGAERGRRRRLPSDRPAREEQPQRWLDMIVAAAPLEGKRCPGCGKTRPPHGEKCRFKQRGEGSYMLAKGELLTR